MFGTNEEVHEVNKSLVKKAEVAREEDEGSGSIYDSRSSLRSELSELRRRSEERRRGGEVEARSDGAQEKIRELRKQVRGSDRSCKICFVKLEIDPKLAVLFIAKNRLFVLSATCCRCCGSRRRQASR